MPTYLTLEEAIQHMENLRTWLSHREKPLVDLRTGEVLVPNPPLTANVLRLLYQPGYPA